MLSNHLSCWSSSSLLIMWILWWWEGFRQPFGNGELEHNEMEIPTEYASLTTQVETLTPAFKLIEVIPFSNNSEKEMWVKDSIRKRRRIGIFSCPHWRPCARGEKICQIKQNSRGGQILKPHFGIQIDSLLLVIQLVYAQEFENLLTLGDGLNHFERSKGKQVGHKDKAPKLLIFGTFFMC